MKLLMDSKIMLNDGNKMPVLGLGTWLAKGEDVKKAVLTALDAGYRHIDTATMYRNETEIGQAIEESGVPRKDLFIVTKIWNSDHGNSQAALETSLKNLGMNYVDLYLIHWPVPERLNTWKVFEKLNEEGLAKSIGVSNFTVRHLKQIMEKSATVPAVNQVEFNPFIYQEDLLDFCAKNKIVLEAYCPLSRGEKLNHATVKKIASAYSKSPAQIMLRWAIQHGIAVIPKSVNAARIRENAEIFDFSLEEKDMKLLDSLDEGFRICSDPTDAP